MKSGEAMDLRNLYYVIRDAVRFVHRKAGTIHPVCRSTCGLIAEPKGGQPHYF